MVHNIHVKELMPECSEMEREERATRASPNEMELNEGINL